MLVLSRRVGESVVIGDDVVVTVLEVRGDVVRVGVQAPRHVSVNRDELLREVAEVNQSAASPSEATIAGLSRAVSDRAASHRAASHRARTTDTRPAP